MEMKRLQQQANLRAAWGNQSKGFDAIVNSNDATAKFTQLRQNWNTHMPSGPSRINPFNSSHRFPPAKQAANISHSSSTARKKQFQSNQTEITKKVEQQRKLQRERDKTFQTTQKQ